jgi:hypothetical protein
MQPEGLRKLKKNPLHNINKYQKIFLISKGWPARKADNLTAIHKATVQKMWEPRRLTILWDPTASYKDSFSLCV